MTAFDLILQTAKAAAFASVQKLAGFELGGDAEAAVADATYRAVDDVMPDPEGIEGQWVIEMLASRPGLLNIEADNGTLGKAIVGAVRDLIIHEIDAEVMDHARSIGIDLPSALTP